MLCLSSLITKVKVIYPIGNLAQEKKTERDRERERRRYLEAPEVPGDGGVPELHLVERGHGEGGGEKEAAHEGDDGREHPEVPGRDADGPHAGPRGVLLLPLPQPADVGRAHPPGSGLPAPAALHRCCQRRTSGGGRRSTLHLSAPRCSIRTAEIA